MKGAETMSQLKKRIAIVTGIGHPGDIGTAICRELADKGSDIFLTYYKEREDWPTTLQKELLEKGIRCETMHADLSDPEAADEILSTVEEKLGMPDILVNNAAYSVNDSYENLSAQRLDDHYTVNVRGTMLLCVTFTRRYKVTGRRTGRIINMTSGQAQGPMVGELSYAASKGAISAFTLSLSAEVAPIGITVNAVNPGPTDTGWMSEEIKEGLLPKFQMGRIGEPEDAARLVAFLASNEAAWITGQFINSEGGFLRK